MVKGIFKGEEEYGKRGKAECGECSEGNGAQAVAGGLKVLKAGTMEGGVTVRTWETRGLEPNAKRFCKHQRADSKTFQSRVRRALQEK